MSNNMQMVDYFIREFYRAKKSGLVDMVTPTFKFKPPLKPELNFEEYMDYIDGLVNSVNLIVHEITSDDDELFKVEYTIETLSVNGGLGIEIKGYTMVGVVDGLVDYVEIIYNANELDPQKLQEFKAELYKSQLQDV
uniref:SnoaL-like domain-containing protein n=1 Tax=OCS116 cluster bacterium TaxID=2030921 RepID=A0A2A4Z970_9PROT